jgi:hypothetical protein
MDIVKYGFLSSVLLVSACSNAYDSAPLSPPKENNQWVTIKGVIPPNVIVTINPKYRSSICRKPRAMSDGTVGETDNLTSYELTVHPKNDGTYDDKLAVNGGSHCDWRLYDILLFTEPKNVEEFKKNLPGKYKKINFNKSTRHITISIPPPHNINVASSKINITPKYYPVFSFSLPIESALTKTLFIEPAGIVKKKYTLPVNQNTNLGEINFSPTIDGDYVVYKKVTGSNVDKSTLIEDHYPNGDIGVNEFSYRPYKYYENKK